MRLRVVPSSLLVVLLGGCVPFPHVARYSPAISGVVVKDGTPVAGVEIRVSSRLTKETHASVTDATGHFSVAPLRKFRALMWLGDPFVDYTVEINHNKQTHGGYSGVGMGVSAARLIVTCNLSQPTESA